MVAIHVFLELPIMLLCSWPCTQFCSRPSIPVHGIHLNLKFEVLAVTGHNECRRAEIEQRKDLLHPGVCPVYTCLHLAFHFTCPFQKSKSALRRKSCLYEGGLELASKVVGNMSPDCYKGGLERLMEDMSISGSMRGNKLLRHKARRQHLWKAMTSLPC